MGLLQSTALTETADGWTPACKGMTVNGVLLGDPILISITPITFGWDDSSLPTGTIDADGTIVTG